VCTAPCAAADGCAVPTAGRRHPPRPNCHHLVAITSEAQAPLSVQATHETRPSDWNAAPTSSAGTKAICAARTLQPRPYSPVSTRKV
jgi:hypothetical protein